MHISDGGISGTVTDVRLIMQSALLTNASGLILCHNHPSGTLIPSAMDSAVTNKIKKACEVLDIELLDHIIISTEGYYSFADSGRL
jgi:DNA repair protein RadC